MASGNALIQWDARSGVQPSSNPATLDVRNGQPVLDFDAGTDESVIFEGVLPAHYGGSGLTLELWCMMSSATSGNVIMQGAVERRNTDADSDSFASAQSSAATAVNGTSGIPFLVSITFSSGANMDSLAAGEPFRLKVNRDADNGSDTASGDLELLSAYLKES
jgi:hypothetical protein